MDNAQTTSQMAQISSVSQLTKMNSTLELLIARGNQADGLAAMPFVGKALTMRTDRLNVVDGKVEGKLELASDVVKARIDLLDQNGAVVKTVDLGQRSAGVVDFSAEMGLKNEGKTFFLRVTTEGKTGKPVAAQTLTRATLDKVAMYPDGTLLTLSNGLELPLEFLQSVADR